MIETINDYMEVSLILLGCLIVYLAYVVLKLSQERTEPRGLTEAVDAIVGKHYEEHEPEDFYEIRMESMKNAQTFAGIQLVDLKRRVGEKQIEELDWVKEAVSLYLIGAVDFIGKNAKCSPAGRRELISFILKSNLQLTHEGASNFFSEALKREPASDSDNMVRAGAKAAKVWLNQKSIPSDFSLQARLDDWGVFA